MEATPVFLAVDAERDGAWADADCGCHLELVDGGAEFRQCPTHAAAPDLLAALKDVRDFLRAHGYDLRIVDAAIRPAEGEAGNVTPHRGKEPQ